MRKFHSIASHSCTLEDDDRARPTNAVDRPRPIRRSAVSLVSVASKVLARPM
jgi:hypothetical protein